MTDIQTAAEWIASLMLVALFVSAFTEKKKEEKRIKEYYGGYNDMTYHEKRLLHLLLSLQGQTAVHNAIKAGLDRNDLTGFWEAVDYIYSEGMEHEKFMVSIVGGEIWNRVVQLKEPAYLLN